MNDEEVDDGGKSRLFDIYQTPGFKWEAMALGTIIDEPVDDVNQAIFFVLDVIIESFVRHINEGVDEAHVKDSP